MRIVLLGLLMLLPLAVTSAEETIVYRWVDENGVVHFSHGYPTDKDVDEVNVKVAYKAHDKNVKQAESIEPPLTSKPSTKEALELSKENEELYKKNCEAAKVNLNILDGFERVVYTDDEGKSRVLSDEEKKEQLSLSQKYKDIYCKAIDELASTKK